MKYTLILILVLTLLSCSKDEKNITTSSDLNGKWVEIEMRIDTLSFNTLYDFERMNLNRGKEIINGYLLPKYASGPYEYKITEGTISLNWMLSSNVSFDEYYFNVIGNKIIIGNFYDSEIGETLTFEKIE